MSRKARIGFTRDFLDKDGNFILPGPGLKLLDEMPNIEHQVFAEALPEVTPQQIEGFDIVISRGLPRWTEHSFIGNEQLLSIHRNGVGYDRIDVPALTEAGVMLCITPAAVRRPVAVAILTFILALSTRLITKHLLTREGRWHEVAKLHGYGLVGKTLGSLGVGNIGHEMFKLAKPLGMRHIAHDPYITEEVVADVGVKLVDLDTLLAESDFLSISCPLNERTHHLIGEKELRRMKPTAFLINTARGAIVDEAALIKALREGWIRGAAIDVFEQEPTPPDNPLLRLDNVITTAHAMVFTDEFLSSVWEIVFRQISQIMRGEVPEGLVNREVWDKPKFQAKLKRFLESIK
ncbi:MAG TPA: dehydrogenase [Dehalococcoidia bacterium]|jgi:phosphoglycerate dehydrogenase-like enzyme|nr:dehydrogenase [Dehalococcoidia bacterium]